MPNEKICPLPTPSVVVGVAFDNSPCTENCAWWDEEKQCCAILSIARAEDKAVKK